MRHGRPAATGQVKANPAIGAKTAAEPAVPAGGAAAGGRRRAGGAARPVKRYGRDIRELRVVADAGTNEDPRGGPNMKIAVKKVEKVEATSKLVPGVS